MCIRDSFPTVIWSEEKPEFVKSLNKASNKYVKDARTREKEFIKNTVTLADHVTQHHLQLIMIF